MLIGDFSESSDLYSTAWTPCGRLSILIIQSQIMFCDLMVDWLPVRFDVLLHVVALDESPEKNKL